MAKPKAESQTYHAMLEEVEQLVEDVSDPQLDLDAMVQKIEHGYGLIKAMRQRLVTTKEKIEKLRSEHEEALD